MVYQQLFTQHKNKIEQKKYIKKKNSKIAIVLQLFIGKLRMHELYRI